MILLTNEEMRQADRAAIAGGISALSLMENAGWGVASAIRDRFEPRPVVVLCGPGNNGGDGLVAARRLSEWGWPVKVALLKDSYSGEAATVASRWKGPVQALGVECLEGRPLILDALFGAGLSRPLSGAAAEIIREIGQRGLDMVSIDIPSGVDGDSGEIRGVAAKARLTVSFFRPKPGHILLPGRELTGELAVVDIGVPSSVLTEIAPKTFLNRPDLWLDVLPKLTPYSHKYKRGCLVIAAGPEMTGAARLAALGARRIGAGLLTIAAPEESYDALRCCEMGNIIRKQEHWSYILKDVRNNVCVLGPGLGKGERTRRLVLSALSSGKICLLDADALTSFESDPQTLFQAGGVKLLTPHDGEYSRLFSFRGDRLFRARNAALAAQAVVVLKGADTVVAAPDGRAVLCDNAPPALATAGSGDVLSGIIGGLLAQDVPAFEAAAMGAWLHGEAAKLYDGAGLIAEDLPVLAAKALGRLLPAPWRPARRITTYNRVVAQMGENGF
ncbi:bifunctional NAD(P)H-hydrate repair enzyme [Alphaproteobacteria bacterium]|nr:bifunctional NAD(P)H-hydrate repair enzyme [Alphaproteobacteria bacterium]